VTFRVKVKDVKQRVLPAIDDELAKDIGSFQTLVELRADVHTRLQKMLDDRADTALAEQIVEKLNEKNPVDVPPSLVEQQCSIMEAEIVQNARRMGQRLTQEDLAKVHDQVHADAERKVRAGLLMAAISRKLGLQVTDQDVQKGLEELAAETGKNVAKVRAEYNDPQRRQLLVGMILEDKVLDAIESKAKIRKGDPAAHESSGEETAPAASATTAETDAASKAKKAPARAAKKTEKGAESASESVSGDVPETPTKP
jgi:trigger factor